MVEATSILAEITERLAWAHSFSVWRHCCNWFVRACELYRPVLNFFAGIEQINFNDLQAFHGCNRWDERTDSSAGTSRASAL